MVTYSYYEVGSVDIENPLIWYKDALYCFGVAYYDDNELSRRPIFYKLELVPVS